MSWVDEPAVVVNEEVVSLGDLMATAKYAGALSFVLAARDAALIRQEAEARGIEATAEELQEAANAYRSARGLHGAQETLDWLAANYLSMEEWETGLEGELLHRKVRQAVIGGRVNEHFAQHLLTFAGAEISQLVVKEEDLACELDLQISEEEADFHALARRYSLDAATRMAGGYRGMVRRGELTAAAQAAVFGAAEGRVVGPFRSREGWWLFKLEKLHPPVLDEALREQIAEELFQEWLDQRRRQAAISMPVLGEG